MSRKQYKTQVGKKIFLLQQQQMFFNAYERKTNVKLSRVSKNHRVIPLGLTITLQNPLLL